MTSQVKFDSHVLNVVTVAVQLVNGLTPGHAGGVPVHTPVGRERAKAVAAALAGDGRRRPAMTAADADLLTDAALDMRAVFEAAHAGDMDQAADRINTLLLSTGARPQLDRTSDSGWHLHFHGVDDTLANGWSAGCAAGLALALGSSLAGRLGVCAASACDRVFVDESRNGKRRFCSPQCLSRVKAAAHRARHAERSEPPRRPGSKVAP